MKKYFLLFLVMLMILGFTHSLGEKVVLTLAGNSKYTPIHRVQTDENKIAFTFNLENRDENIDGILDKLKEFEVKATFFLTEELISLDMELVRKIYISGHQVGWLITVDNDFRELSLQNITERIEVVSTKLEQNIGVGLEVLRPMNLYNDTLLVACKNLGVYCVLWDVDSKDNREIGINDIVQRVKLETQKGSVILFNSKGKYTLGAVSILLQELREAKVGMVPLQDLLHKDRYQITIDGEQIKKR